MRKLELTGECDGCGAPDGVWMPYRNEHICPRCSAISDMADAATLDQVLADIGQGIPADFQYRQRADKQADA